MISQRFDGEKHVRCAAAFHGTSVQFDGSMLFPCGFHYNRLCASTLLPVRKDPVYVQTSRLYKMSKDESLLRLCPRLDDFHSENDHNSLIRCLPLDHLPSVLSKISSSSFSITFLASLPMLLLVLPPFTGHASLPDPLSCA